MESPTICPKCNAIYSASKPANRKLVGFYGYPQWKDDKERSSLDSGCVWIDPEAVLYLEFQWGFYILVHLYGAERPQYVAVGGDNPEQTLQGVIEALGFEWSQEIQATWDHVQHPQAKEANHAKASD